MGDETKQKLCLRGLQNSSGYLQKKIGKRIETRYTPKITFVLDKGVKHSMEVTRILDEVLPKKLDSDETDSETVSTTQADSSEIEGVRELDD